MLGFGTPLGAWGLFAALTLFGVLLAGSLARAGHPRVGAVLATVGLVAAWLVAGRSFHVARTSDREVTLSYAIPPRTVRVPAEEIAGASWHPGCCGRWVLEVTTRDGRRFESASVPPGDRDTLERRVIMSALGVSR